MMSEPLEVLFDRYMTMAVIVFLYLLPNRTVEFLGKRYYIHLWHKPSACLSSVFNISAVFLPLLIAYVLEHFASKF